jgi:spermidine synthase
MTQNTTPSSMRNALALALFSVCILASEIALTRIFSVVFWYHFGFLILSTSMLGFGFGGLLVRFLKPRLEAFRPEAVVAMGIGVSGPLLILALVVITHNHFSPLFVQESIAGLLKLVIAALALIPPFLVMGATVLYMLQQWVEDVSKLYAANLIGSALGCLAVLLMLDAAGGLVTYILLAAAMPLIALWYGWPLGRRWIVGAALAAAFVLVTLPRMNAIYPLQPPFDKVAGWAKHFEVVHTDWTSLSKVDIGREDEFHAQGFGLWGLSPLNPEPLPERLGVVIDYWAYTTIIKDKKTPGYYDFYDWLPMYLAYDLVEKPNALIIGAGGGMDIKGALRSGAAHIDAVEINPVIVEAMKGPLAKYSGNIYLRPEVNAHLAEGRRFVESSDKTYDIIQLSGVDTYSATQAGAFALSENFLYTIEAMHSYLDHLSDDGILTLTRWYAPSDEGLPRFSMRLFTLAIESLASYGYAEPWKNILFVRSGAFTVMLIRKTPISTEEIRTVERINQKRGYAFLYRPDRDVPEGAYFYEYARAADRDAWRDAYRFNVNPPTDDSPFFFEHRKMRNIYKFQSFLLGLSKGLDGQTILAILLLEMLLVALGLGIVSAKVEGGKRNPLGWLYFTAIGLGFMTMEVTFSQRLVLFLGHPAYALSVVMFAILLFSGIGSLLAPKFAKRLNVSWLLAAVAFMLLLWALGGGWLIAQMMAWPKALRMVIAVLLLAPPAFCMGMAFPEAIRRLRLAGETQYGLYWAFNGIASVTASVLAVILAMSVGFTVVLIVALICYVLAAILLHWIGLKQKA